MFFDIVQNDYINEKIYNSSFYKIRLSNDLITKYEDIIFKGNNLYINGFLHSYKKDNRMIYYIYPKEIKVLDKDFDIEKDNKSPIIDYDEDGVMLWNGQRCESIPPSEEEKKEMEDLLSAFR